MSTITVVKKNGVAAIAADTLTKWGYIKESSDYVANHHKIIRCGHSYIAATGSMTFGQALRDYLSGPGAELSLDSKEEIFSSWNRLHLVMKESYYLNAEEDEDDSFESTRASVLIANPAGIFGVGSYRAVQEFTKFYSYGAGCEFALGAMYVAYENGMYSAEQIARLGVEASAEFDDSTGKPVISYTVELR